MGVSRFVQDALRFCVAAVIVAGCGGHAAVRAVLRYSRLFD
jgi:hypothetical protein